MSASLALAFQERNFPAQVTEKETMSILRACNTGAGICSERELAHVIELMPFRKTVEMQTRLRGIDPSVIASSFLRSAYGRLDEFGVAYTIDASPSEEGGEAIEEVAIRSERAGLRVQANQYHRDFEKLQGLRWLFGEMRERGLLGSDFLVPQEDLAETFFAEPVWFASGPDGSREYFEDRLPQDSAQTFLAFNPRVRPLASFDNIGETVPAHIMEVMEVGHLVFDRMAITTPYHDLTAETWKSPQQFVRYLDPEVFGFINGISWVFRLGRWSGNGFLSEKCSQIAATARFVRETEQDALNFFNEFRWRTGFLNRSWADKFTFQQQVTGRYTVQSILDAKAAIASRYSPLAQG